MPNRNDYPLTLFYDGACPLCRLEMERLAAHDGLRRLVFVDIAGAGFDTGREFGPGGPAMQALRALIHGRRPDGSLTVGVETLQLAYSAVGWGALLAPTHLPFLRPALDVAYAAFARNRQGISALLAPAITRLSAGLAATRAGDALRRTQACEQGNCERTPS